MVRRVGDSAVELPGLFPGDITGLRAAPGAVLRLAAAAAERISRSRMRPVRPEPATRVQSTPSSRAVLAARGLMAGGPAKAACASDESCACASAAEAEGGGATGGGGSDRAGLDEGWTPELAA